MYYQLDITYVEDKFAEELSGIGNRLGNRDREAIDDLDRVREYDAKGNARVAE